MLPKTGLGAFGFKYTMLVATAQALLKNTAASFPTSCPVVLELCMLISTGAKSSIEGLSETEKVEPSDAVSRRLSPTISGVIKEFFQKLRNVD